MKIAVLSGKGGAGKTFVSVNLAAAADRATYVDCDVEEPNGRLFLKPEGVTSRPVEVQLPSFDPARCTGCRKCVDFCRFNALFYVGGTPMVFPEVCHSCGGCQLVCPEHAVSEAGSEVGRLEEGTHRNIHVITGILNLGEASGVPVIQEALKTGLADNAPVTVLDCPPGSACSVMETITAADCCILVAEPTAFGFHNFRMVHQLTRLMGKPCGVVVNKQDTPYEPLERFCTETNTPILLRIPFRESTARLCADGKVALEEDEEIAAMFRGLLAQIGGGCK